MPGLTCQLLLPSGFLDLVADSRSLPALAALLRYARKGAVFEGDGHAWRCRFFGVPRQQDWPVAPYACLAEGLAPASHYWLCAEPMHLQLRRDGFTLLEGARFALTPAQSGDMVDSLNGHFAGEGMRFFAPHPARWYLRLDAIPRLQTCPLPGALGQDVQRCLPKGADALRWHGRLNEIQMLLHGHPVNQALEQRGDMPVNSLWLWGGGVLAQPGETAHAGVWANDPVTRGLALGQGASLCRLPADAAEWLGGAVAGQDHLIVPELPDSYDLPSREEALVRLDRHWIAPLAGFLRTGRIARLDLHLAGVQSVHAFSLTRADLYKFWRRSRPLEACLG